MYIIAGRAGLLKTIEEIKEALGDNIEDEDSKVGRK